GNHHVLTVRGRCEGGQEGRFASRGIVHRQRLAPGQALVYGLSEKNARGAIGGRPVPGRRRSVDYARLSVHAGRRIRPGENHWVFILFWGIRSESPEVQDLARRPKRGSTVLRNDRLNETDTR